MNRRDDDGSNNNNNNYGLPTPILALLGVLIGLFVLIGIGGILLSGLYMMAVASMVWTNFVRFGPFVGFVSFGFIVAFFGGVGVFVYQLLFAEDKSYDRGDNFDNY